MDGRIDIFTLLFLILAVVIILRLRSVLGRRTGDDDARVERLKSEQRARAATQAEDKVVTLPRRERTDAPAEAPAASATAAGFEDKVRTLASGNKMLTDGLMSIARADRNFDPDHFVAGARQAYEMIVTAFAEGNRKTLKGLLSREVFDGFAAALSERDSRGEQIDQSFVGINKAEIVEAEIKAGVAHVTVRFVSDLISATRDKAGVVVSGDPKRIKEVIDIWTFARDVVSRDPNWKLVATQAPG